MRKGPRITSPISQTDSNRLGIGPGTRKHADAAAFSGTPVKSTLPEWYPELLASVSQQTHTDAADSQHARQQRLEKWTRAHRAGRARPNRLFWVKLMGTITSLW
jgi:hypothetical protein